MGIRSDMGGRGERIQRLVLCRNVLRAEAALQLTRGGHVVILDLDCRHGKPGSLLHTFATMGDFDVATANNVGAYRDMWALRSKHMGMDYDCFWELSRMRKDGNCKKYQIHVHPNVKPFALEAGFNGMGIYNARSITGA